MTTADSSNLDSETVEGCLLGATAERDTDKAFEVATAFKDESFGFGVGVTGVAVAI